MTKPTTELLTTEQRLSLLAEWLRQRGEPDSGIFYEGGGIERRQARVELSGADATFVAVHFHGSGAQAMCTALTELLASRTSPATDAVAWTGSGSMAAIAAGQEGHIWPENEPSHPIPLYATPQPVAVKVTDDIAPAMKKALGLLFDLGLQSSDQYQALENALSSLSGDAS